MPVSKKRSRKQTPARRKRQNKNVATRARETQAAQAAATKKRQRSYAQARARRVIGISLFVLAALVAGTHFMEHLDMIRFAAPGVEDLVAGYPMAALLAFAGAIVIGS
jgi:glutamine synthetase adenylyltransferase